MFLVAGCSEIPGLPNLSTGGSVIGGNGLAITSFTAEPTPVFSGSTVRVTGEFQNMGGTTVNTDSALIYLTGTDVSLGDTSGDSWHGKSAGNDMSEIRHFNKNMLPENVVKGTPAVTDRIVWNLVAPDMTAGQTRQDTFIMRVYSKYASGVNGNIWVYSESESQAAKSAGTAPETSSFTPVSGPVGVSVRLSPDPIVLYQGENQFTFNIDIINTGTGSIYSKSINYATATAGDLVLDSENELNHVDVTVDGGDLSIQECSGDQQIMGGKSITLSCTATVPNPSALTFKSFPLNVMVNYGYYTQSEATVTVQGKTKTTTPSPSCTGSSDVCPSWDGNSTMCNLCGCTYNSGTCEGPIPCSSPNIGQTKCSVCGCTWG